GAGYEKVARMANKLVERKRGDGGIYQRGDVWWIRYSHRGKEIRESSESTDKTNAEKLLQKRIREVSNDRDGIQAFAPNAGKIYVDELLDNLEKDYRLNG